MKKWLKSAFKALRLKYDFYKRTLAYKNRYKQMSTELFKKNIQPSQLNEYRKKWSVLGQKVETDTLLLSYNLSGIVDLNIVPENIFSVLVERSLNSCMEGKFYEIKNVYSKMFQRGVFPKCYIHKIAGVYYDSEFNVIEDLNKYENDLKAVLPLIVKSSRDTFGGKDVTIVSSVQELKASMRNYNFLVCQEVIIQHDVLSKINNSSINTVRTCLYRKDNGEFEVLNNSIRFGVNGSLDNETSGGIVCYIDCAGRLNKYAVDKYAKKYFQHPNSGVAFADVEIPKFLELNTVAKLIANEVLLGRLVSLDMCLDETGSWRCIEINMFGQTIRFAQYAGRGFFGIYTNDVINYVKAMQH